MTDPLPRRLSRFLPPPAMVIRPLVRLTPQTLQRTTAELVLNHFFARPLGEERLDFLERRTIAIGVTDLGIEWKFSAHGRSLRMLPPDSAADVTIRGDSRQFMALGLRREDPDTFFFRRELAVSGDTELGLAVKNFLDSIDADDMPLLLRNMPARLRERLAAFLAPAT